MYFGFPSAPGGTLCDPLSPKPVACLWPKFSIFSTLPMTWPKIWYRICDCCGWHSCAKHNLWRAFVDGLIDNEEKVASSKTHTQFKTRVREPYPVYDQNGQNRYPIYDQNGWKSIPFGAAHIYIAHIREYPSPPSRRRRLLLRRMHRNSNTGITEFMFISRRFRKGDHID